MNTSEEKKQNVDITVDEINAEKSENKLNDKVTDEDVKAAVKEVNPDCGTLDRG